MTQENEQPGKGGSGPAAPQPSTLDAQVRVRVSRDRMSASLTIDPPLEGGKRLEKKNFDEALAQAKVVSGIDAALLESLERNPVYQRDFKFAAGTPPVRGKDGTVQLLFSVLGQGHPRVREDGTVDYRDLGYIRNVRKGEVLCRIAPPTQGTPGVNVAGETLAAASGKEAPVPRGRNTELSSDGSELRAAVNGQISLENGMVNVLENYIVAGNVDNSTGNIRFIGGVTVLGSIGEGFEVESGGDVEVGGSVLGGNIRAQGKITVRGGIVGMGRSEITCEGDLRSLFLENCRVRTHGSVATGNIFQCEVRCRGNLTLEGARAKLIGGKCTVGGDLTADSIGSPACLATELTLGADPEDVAALSAAEKEIKAGTGQIGKLRQILTLLDGYRARGKLTEDKQALRERSAASLAQLETELGALDAKRTELRRRMEETVKGKVSCRGVMHRGVRLTIGGSVLEIGQPVVRMEFQSGEDGIVQVPIV